MAGIVTVPQMRYLRRRKLRGILRGAEGANKGIPRLKRLEAWLAARVTALTGTGLAQTITAVDTVNDRVTIAAHGRVAGDGPFIVAATVTLPDGILADTVYWVNDFSVNELTLHRSREDAYNAVNPVNIIDAGSGTITLEPADNINDGMVALVREEPRGKGISTPRLTAETDIDNLV